MRAFRPVSQLVRAGETRRKEYVRATGEALAEFREIDADPVVIGWFQRVMDE